MILRACEKNHYIPRPNKRESCGRDRGKRKRGQGMTGSKKEIQSERFLSLENIFRGCILAEFPVDGELRQAAKERYGLDADEPIAIFAVWLGHHYEERYEELERLLEPCFSQAAEYESCMIHSARNRAVAVFFYHMRDVKAMERWCAGTVLPELDRAFALTPVFSWTVCEGLKDMPEGFARLMESRTWNLCFPEGILITSEMTAQVETVPLKYPLEIETQLKQAVSKRDRAGYEQALEQFIKSCVSASCHPDEIREACVRLALAVMNLARSIGRVDGEIPARTVLGDLSHAVTWHRVMDVMAQLFDQVTAAEEEDPDMSLLVKQAKELVRTYYDQGITLEELSEKLHVTEEYLSARFKKETGMSFTETVRKYRIEKVKELLLDSSLKLNQIADMVGYSDPKYMSKVFKEEVGMLPAEFRKENG